MHKPKGRSAVPEEVSPGTLLDRCLFDGDAAANTNGRRHRRKALGLSLALETATVVLLVIAPLLSGVARPAFSPPMSMPVIFGARHLSDAKLLRSKPSAHPPGLFDTMIRFAPGHIAHSAPPTEGAEGQAPAGNELGIALPGSDISGVRDMGLREISPPPPVENRRSEMKHPVKVNAGVEEAKLILRIEPRYSPLAVMTRTEGTVILHAFISREGRITALDVLSGPPLLVGAALDAVQQWRYRPTLLDGEPVEVETTITVIFRLQR